MEKHKERSALQAVIDAKCPQCRQGDIYVYKMLSTKFTTMNKTCSECGLYYEREPGFFWGAMYISYGFAIATVLTAFAIMTILVDHVKLWQYFVAIFVPLFIIAPFAFRYSRVLMLYLFAGVSYDKDAIEKNEDKIKQEKIN